jgi:hypothetical protein
MKRQRKYRNPKFASIEKVRVKRVLEPAKPWTLKEKLSVWGTLAGVMLLVFTPFFDQYMDHRNIIEERIKSWRSEYHLSDQQVNEIRKIERDFHRFGRFFSNDPPPTPADISRHHQEIASRLDPAIAKIFLERENEPREK